MIGSSTPLHVPEGQFCTDFTPDRGPSFRRGHTVAPRARWDGRCPCAPSHRQVIPEASKKSELFPAPIAFLKRITLCLKKAMTERIRLSAVSWGHPVPDAAPLVLRRGPAARVDSTASFSFCKVCEKDQGSGGLPLRLG
jgi:hypothetical protein